MKIGFAGTPEVAVPALQALLGSHHQVTVVISRPDAPVGRSKRPVPSPVSAAAAAAGVPVLTPDHPRDPTFVSQVANLELDAVAVVAYGALVPQAVLDLVPQGWINLHFSLLPRWRGAAPVQRAIWAGDTQTGATTFRLVRELDAGPVFDTLTRPLSPTDTAGEVLADLAVSGADLLLATFNRIADGAHPVDQPSEGITVAPKIEVADARIDWHRPAVEVSRQIRATSPAPGAWSELAGQRFKVLTVAATDEPAPTDVPPGGLAASKRNLWCGTADQPLALGRVQAFGKPAMAGADWARGAGLNADSRLQ